MVEKPLAHNLDDARMLAALASRHPNIPTAVGYCHRFTPAIIEMKRRIATDELGNLVTLREHLRRLESEDADSLDERPQHERRLVQ